LKRSELGWQWLLRCHWPKTR